MARLEFSNVSKSYGKTVAVKDINLVIEDNEFFCIFGPPSCGKSTILRLLLGLVAPDEGEISIDGVPVVAKGPKERNLAMVFQNLALFPHMTAKQNLAFPLVERKVDKATIERRVAEVADTLRITPLLKKLPAHLSGGERQRVAIGRALVRDPAAFLMDEPIAALDARLREEMRVELKRLQRELNHTLVYVTHDQEEAMSVADRMAIFEDGEIRQTGTPAEIYNNPNGRYVAELIGSPPMNFVEGKLNGDGGWFEGRDVPFSIGFDETIGTGAVTLAVRPEDIDIDEGGGDGGIEANIYEVEPLGAYTIVDVSVGAQILKVQAPGQPQFQLNQPVRLMVDPSRCHLFDGETGDVVRSAA
jgi:multiple sugar transport system ATP-binding protein